MCVQELLFSEKIIIHLFDLAVLIEVLPFIRRFKILQASKRKELNVCKK